MPALGESERGHERTVRAARRPRDVDHVELDAKLAVYHPAAGSALIVRVGVKGGSVRRRYAWGRDDAENGRRYDDTKPRLHA